MRVKCMICDKKDMLDDENPMAKNCVIALFIHICAWNVRNELQSVQWNVMQVVISDYIVIKKSKTIGKM